MPKTYTIMLNPKGGYPEGYEKISEEGALIIWKAYCNSWRMPLNYIDRREQRGGIAYTSEIEDLIKHGELPEGFEWKIYIVR